MRGEVAERVVVGHQLPLGCRHAGDQLPVAGVHAPQLADVARGVRPVGGGVVGVDVGQPGRERRRRALE